MQGVASTVGDAKRPMAGDTYAEGWGDPDDDGDVSDEEEEEEEEAAFAYAADGARNAALERSQLTEAHDPALDSYDQESNEEAGGPKGAATSPPFFASRRNAWGQRLLGLLLLCVGVSCALWTANVER